MASMKIYMRIKSLTFDGETTLQPTGMVLDFGETDKEVNYEELTKSLNKEAVVKRLNEIGVLPSDVSNDDVEFVTPEEYQQEFGDDDG